MRPGQPLHIAGTTAECRQSVDCILDVQQCSNLKSVVSLLVLLPAQHSRSHLAQKHTDRVWNVGASQKFHFRNQPKLVSKWARRKFNTISICCGV